MLVYVCVVADVIGASAGHHREPRGEAHEGRVRAGGRQEDGLLHGRLQHASQGRLRLATATRTHQTVARLRLLVRPTKTTRQIRQGTEKQQQPTTNRNVLNLKV